jgi:hypothetical protein
MRNMFSCYLTLLKNRLFQKIYDYDCSPTNFMFSWKDLQHEELLSSYSISMTYCLFVALCTCISVFMSSPFTMFYSCLSVTCEIQKFLFPGG